MGSRSWNLRPAVAGAPAPLPAGSARLTVDSTGGTSPARWNPITGLAVVTLVQSQPGQSIKAPTTPGGAYVVGAPEQGVPTNMAELKALRATRSELSDQISNVSSRRRSLADQLKTADPGARKGLEDRVRVLDDRLIRMERELDRTGDALARTSPVLLAAESSQPSIPNIPRIVAQDIVPIVAILSVFVLAPMAVAFSRFIWRRAGAPPRQHLLSEQAAQQRLDQLQQAVDTIAIEVERISEGQRFISKVLSDKALSPGAAEPVRQASKAASAANRG